MRWPRRELDLEASALQVLLAGTKHNQSIPEARPPMFPHTMLRLLDLVEVTICVLNF